MIATTYEPTDRRPMGARQWRVTQWLADRLARRGASPNAISVGGMVAGIGAGAALAATALAPGWERVAWLGAAGLVLLRGLANVLDGMVAVQTGRASRTGELFNEVPDRVSDVAMLVGAGYAAGGLPVLGYVAACVALFTAYVRAMGKAAGGRHEFCGPMAKPHRMYVIVLVAVFCGLAPPAWHPVWGESGIPAAGLAVIIAGGMLTAARRLRRTAAGLRGGGS